MRKNFSENDPKFGQVPSKTFAGPVTGRKSLKNVGLHWRPPISLPKPPKCLEPNCMGFLLKFIFIFRFWLKSYKKQTLYK